MCLYYLSAYPTYYEKLEQEINKVIKLEEEVTYDNINKIKLLKEFIKECLRISSPAFSLVEPRQAQEDTFLGDIKIRKGDYVDLLNIAHGLNPKFFNNPKKFYPERFYDENISKNLYFLPFGIGQRNCIGQHFALISIKLSVVQFIRNFHLRRTTVPLEMILTNAYTPKIDNLIYARKKI